MPVCQICARAGPAVVWARTQPAAAVGKARAVNEGAGLAEIVPPPGAVADAADARSPAEAAGVAQEARSRAQAPAARAGANPERLGICHLQVVMRANRTAHT